MNDEHRRTSMAITLNSTLLNMLALRRLFQNTKLFHLKLRTNKRT
jgi:hypothetical protein